MKSWSEPPTRQYPHRRGTLRERPPLREFDSSCGHPFIGLRVWPPDTAWPPRIAAAMPHPLPRGPLAKVTYALQGLDPRLFWKSLNLVRVAPPPPKARYCRGSSLPYWLTWPKSLAVRPGTSFPMNHRQPPGWLLPVTEKNG